MRNVLLAYDGSDSARRAVQYVIDYVVDTKVPLTVHLLNVQQEPLIFGEYVTADMLDQMSKSFIDKGQEILKEAAERLEGAGLSCQQHVVLGNVADLVRETVAREGCDTVVMGTRGLGSFSGLLLGSVTTKVIHETPVPVLLVK